MMNRVMAYGLNNSAEFCSMNHRAYVQHLKTKGLVLFRPYGLPEVSAPGVRHVENC
jgi:hypothetical protein